MYRRSLFLLPLMAMLLAGCRSDSTNELRPNPTPEPTPVPPAPQTLTVAYRVTGTISNTQITYFSSIQGTTQVKTDLPWAVSYQTTDLHPFLYLAAETPIDNFLEGNLVVQIFVNGVLFREARGSGFVISVAASGEVP
jgi:hypothetical protein